MRRLIIAFLAAFGFALPAYAACDLSPTIGARSTPNPGQAIMASLEIANHGDTPCPGTLDNPNGYMIDIFLSTDRNGPSSWAIYSPTWHEDVLLLGGRMSRTTTLAAGVNYRFGAPSYESGPFTLPTGMPAGDYFLCAGVDMGNRVAESNERNNVACLPLHIAAPLRLSPPTHLPLPTPH